jgi:hypothetical protein
MKENKSINIKCCMDDLKIHVNDWELCNSSPKTPLSNKLQQHWLTILLHNSESAMVAGSALGLPFAFALGLLRDCSDWVRPSEPSRFDLGPLSLRLGLVGTAYTRVIPKIHGQCRSPSNYLLEIQNQCIIFVKTFILWMCEFSLQVVKWIWC